MAGTTFKLSGFRELETALLELSTKEAKKIGRAALRQAAKPILQEARANVPVREGRLKKALRLKVDRGTDANGNFSDARMEAEVGLGGAIAKQYRKRLTKRKRKTAKGKVRDYWYQIGSRPDVYGKFVEFGTSDTAPKPFMRPAWDKEGGQRAIDRVGKELGEGIEKAAKALKKG